MNLLAIHICTLFLFHGDWKRKDRLFRYLLICCSVSLGPFLIPCIRYKVFTSIDNMLTNLIIGFIATAILLHFRIGIRWISSLVVLVASFFIFLFPAFIVGERIKILFGMTSNSDPIALSIGEHQPTFWMLFYLDFHLTLIITGMYVVSCMKKIGSISRK